MLRLQRLWVDERVLVSPERHSSAELRFSYGTMGSGKSTMALQIHHNLAAAGLRGMLCTQLDRVEGRVSSRLGVSADAYRVEPEVDLFSMAKGFLGRHGRLDYLVCDEAQFYLAAQVDQLVRVVDQLSADVYCFGLLRDFRGRLFPGTTRLLEMADSCVELDAESRCWCGRKATHNARLIDGRQVYEGDLMVVDDPGNAAVATYELRCRQHWIVGESRDAALAGESTPPPVVEPSPVATS